ncbi:MAG: hypothetical protein AUG49_10990 [Catenulispora sp. 13_1_20CM_3_70_7]|nr:MAG: hypothetical protein AUG49_10990 [Catenulispora sp. 13_1_20CM_3_70_7]
MSMSRVRLALVTSVTCSPPSGPPVRFQISQVSMVPNRTSPHSACSYSPGVWSSSQRMRGAEKYVASGSPERSATIAASGCLANSATRVSVRVSCQVIARLIGWPVRRSHSTVVSRWLAMPRAATCRGSTPTRCSASGARCSRLRQISAASCSTQPGLGKYCLCSRWVTDTRRPPRSNRMQRVEVVP